MAANHRNPLIEIIFDPPQKKSQPSPTDSYSYIHENPSKGRSATDECYLC